MNEIHCFCTELAQRCTALAQLLQDHISDYDELLPHVFMGDVVRHVLSDRPQRREIVGQLDYALANGGEDVQNLIAVSFVQNFENEEELDRALADVWAEMLRNEWHRQHL